VGLAVAGLKTLLRGMLERGERLTRAREGWWGCVGLAVAGLKTLLRGFLERGERLTRVRDGGGVWAWLWLG
jgi:hypothetical protein